MSARIHPERARTPTQSELYALLDTLKRRLFHEDEDDVNISQPQSKQRKDEHYSVAHPFGQHETTHVDEDDQRLIRHYDRSRHISPSPEPDQQLAKELQDRYTRLRATLHSAATFSLTTVQSKISAKTDSYIRDNRQKLLLLESDIEALTAPIQNTTVDYTATGEDGRRRTAAVIMEAAVAAFEEKVERKVAELDDFWIELEEIKTEIKKFASGMDLVLRYAPGLTHAGSSGVAEGAAASSSTSALPSEASTAFGEDLEIVSRDMIEEMAIYEQKFLQEIEKHAEKLLHSALLR